MSDLCAYKAPVIAAFQRDERGARTERLCVSRLIQSSQQPYRATPRFCVTSSFLKILFLFIFRERGREGEREGEKLQGARET